MMEGAKAPTLQEHIDRVGFGRFHIPVLLAICGLVMAEGMELTIMSLLQDPIIDEYQMSDYSFAVLGSCVFGGMIVGGLAASSSADWYGRRPVLQWTNVIFCISGLLSALAAEFWTFVCLRICCSIAIGAMIPVGMSLLLEISPTNHRALMGMSLAGTAWSFGTLSACMVGFGFKTYMGDNPFWWRGVLLACAVPGVLTLPYVFIGLPESPHYLLVRHRKDELKECLKQMGNSNQTPRLAVMEVADDLKGNVAQDSARQSFDDLQTLFAEDALWTTLYLAVANGTCGFIYAGQNFIYPKILQEKYEVELSDQFKAVAMNCIAELGVVFLALWAMDSPSLGRKHTNTLGFIATVLCAIGAVLLREDLESFKAMNCLIRAAVSCPFTVIGIYAGELYPSSLRATAVFSATLWGRLAAMFSTLVVTAAYRSSANDVFYEFIALASVATIASILYPRETLGQPLPLTMSDMRSYHIGMWGAGADYVPLKPGSATQKIRESLDDE